VRRKATPLARPLPFLPISAVVCLLLVLTSADSHAQGTAVVREPAPIYLLPDSSRVPLRTASAGTTLRILEAQTDWLQVEFNDPQFGPRIGWVRRALVTVNTPETTPMDLSVPPSPPTRPAATPALPEPSGRAQPVDGPASPRQGFWFNVGLGLGTLGCEDCVDRTNGLSGGLSLGGTLGNHVLLGVGTSGFSKNVDGDLLTVGTLDARVRVYPVRRSGFFLTGGVGVGTLSYGDDDAELGLGLILGVGWDIRVGRNVSLTPFWSGFAMANDIVDANVGQLGIGVTIH
jgi:hypothetical protein